MLTRKITGLVIAAAITAPQSTFMLKMDASPRGVYHPPIPHGDQAGWDRIQKIVPWYYKAVCTDGPGIPAGKADGVASVSPILISTTDTSDEIADGMVKAMVENFADYKEGAPGA